MNDFSANDIAAIWLTLKLAAVVTLLLLLLCTPLAWWLARTKSRIAAVIGTIVAMPLVLPPTVIGFYLLLLMGPNGAVGQLTQALGIGLLPFTFSGLVMASLIYSLPFVVQPLQNAFESVGEPLLETAATLRANTFDTFRSVVLPLSVSGYITAATLGFAHTVGEFGVVLMLGGNIPKETQVLSVQVYNHVEAMQYSNAHWLSAGMLLFCFIVLLLLQGVRKAGWLRV
ncbi:MAG: molybdate ABC transporter permease subunit [Pseudomonadales bacterium]